MDLDHGLDDDGAMAGESERYDVWTQGGLCCLVANVSSYEAHFLFQAHRARIVRPHKAGQVGVYDAAPRPWSKR